MTLRMMFDDPFAREQNNGRGVDLEDSAYHRLHFLDVREPWMNA